MAWQNNFDDDDARDEGWSCELCGGEVMPMGKLGNRTHGRCRDCGMESSKSSGSSWNESDRYSAKYFLEFAEKSHAMTRSQVAEEFRPIVQRASMLRETCDDDEIDEVVESLLVKVRTLNEAGLDGQLVEWGMADAFSGILGLMKAGGVDMLKTTSRSLVMKIAGWLGLGELGQKFAGLFAQAIMVGFQKGGLNGLVKMFTDCNYSSRVVTTAVCEVLVNPRAELGLGFLTNSIVSWVRGDQAFGAINNVVSSIICEKLGQVADKLTDKAKEKFGNSPQPEALPAPAAA